MRLQVLLDGKPVYLYRFTQGCYEDKRQFVFARAERLSEGEVLARMRDVLDQLPEEIDFDDEVDLFRRAAELAGFVYVDDNLLIGARLRDAYPPCSEREYLANALTNAIEEEAGRR